MDPVSAGCHRCIRRRSRRNNWRWRRRRLEHCRESRDRAVEANGHRLAVGIPRMVMQSEALRMCMAIVERSTPDRAGNGK